jgi:ubiquitin-activating enzyme E1
MSSFVSRFSRQKYAIGEIATNRLSNASICIIGYNGLAQEIIKNLVLMGVSSIDFTENCFEELEEYQKTSLYFTTIADFQKLNADVKIGSVEFPTDYNKYDIVILVNAPLGFATNFNDKLRQSAFNTKFIYACCYGLLGFHYTDLGETFVVENVDGKVGKPVIIDRYDGIANTVMCREKHGLNDGDTVTIDNVAESRVEKITPYEFRLLNKSQQLTTKTKIIKKVISKTIAGIPLDTAISSPTFHIADFSKQPDHPQKLLNTIIAYENGLLEHSEDDLHKKFHNVLRGDFLPLASIVGGIVSHEVVKIVSKQCTPITGFCFEDCLDLVESNGCHERWETPCSRVASLTTDGKRSSPSSVGLLNIFGETGLETIQNFKPFIVGSGAIGCELLKNLVKLGIKNIFITDNDKVEQSNLCRQFLFQQNDVGTYKSITASQKANAFNINTTICPYILRASKETENTFTPDFYNNIDIILNALDNVEARQYTDSKALKHDKPLIDSGTVGESGGIQVVIPNKTISYSSIKEQATTTIPICTIKSFPYLQEHTIQWARELFEGEFKTKKEKMCVKTFIKQNFYDNIQKLLEDAEKNKRDNATDGGAVRLPAKDGLLRLPTLLEMDELLQHPLCHVVAELFLQMFNANEDCNGIDFDKDISLHLEFIQHASNIRNKQYGIPETDVDTAHRISGNIIPAMVTTTAVVAGYQTIEFIKIALGKQNNECREFNLNTGYNNGMETVPATKHLLNGCGEAITIWTKFYTTSRFTQQIADEIKHRFGCSPYLMMNGENMVWNEECLVAICEVERDTVFVFEELDVEIAIIFL